MMAPVYFRTPKWMVLDCELCTIEHAVSAASWKLQLPIKEEHASRIHCGTIMKRIKRNKGTGNAMPPKRAAEATACKQKHRVLLIDYHPILRKGIAQLINQEAD